MKTFTKYLVTLALAVCLSACATAHSQPYHQFTFNGWSDKWAKQVDLLEYSYGDQYRMVMKKAEPDEQTLGYRTNINGPMPVGEFLYVKWRIKETGEVIEEKVDLRNRLARNMFEHAVTFVIDGRQLYVYLVTPKAKPVEEPPPLKTFLSRYTVTYEIYPTNTYKP